MIIEFFWLKVSFILFFKELIIFKKKLYNEVYFLILNFVKDWDSGIFKPKCYLNCNKLTKKNKKKQIYDE